MTGSMLQDALIDFLNKYLAGYSLKASTGEMKPVRVYRQWLPQPKSLAVNEQTSIEDSIEVIDGENASEETEPDATPPGDYNKEELESYLPCVIAKLDSCSDVDRQTVILESRLIVGIYDTALDNQGYVDALNLIEAIRLELLNMTFLDDRFRLRELKYSMVDDQPWPVYFGVLNTTWETRKVSQSSPSLVRYGGIKNA